VKRSLKTTLQNPVETIFKNLSELPPENLGPNSFNILLKISISENCINHETEE